MRLSLRAAAALAATAVPLAAGLAPDLSPFGEVAYADFKRLTCNPEAYQDGIFDGCVSWSSLIGTAPAGMVTIDCGVCVNYDVASDTTLVIPDGLDIIGALVIPKNHRGTIETPYVYVQGHLKIDNDLVVDGTNKDGFKFVMTGTDDGQFIPHPDNTESCRWASCNVGKKAFVVAGGQVHINAYREECPTWVNLKDVVINDDAVVATDYPVPPVPPAGCTNNILSANFQNGRRPFKSSLGCYDQVVATGSHDDSAYFSVSGRKRKWQGPFVDLKTDVQGCVVPNQMYLIHAKARISPEDTAVKPETNCHRDGTHCLSLKLHTNDKYKGMTWRTISQIPAAARSTDNEWFDFVAEFEFTDADLNTTALYHMLYFAGPEEGVKIDIDDVTFVLPDAAMFPDPAAGSVCNNLVINGDAENSNYFKFPQKFIGNQGAHLSVKQEEVNSVTNNYFSITGRDATWTSIENDLITDCIVRNTIYQFQQRIRLHSAETTNVRIVLKTTQPNSTSSPRYTTETLGACEGVDGSAGWVTCTRNFLFREEHETAESIQLAYVVEDDRTSDIDFDDIKVTRYAPPIGQLVVPSSVAGCWGAGAEILQTSYTLDPEDEEILNITGITDNGDGTASISIDPPIAKPTTEKDDPNMAVEIVLLNRNVKIEPKEGDDLANPLHGAHFMIAHTPNTSQTVCGMEFHKMGQQGIFGRYPMHIHMSKSIEGTLISKNLVRHSNQRCYVIHGTHNVTIKENVAHDSFGHCFMLEDGIEQDNHFEYNLGAHTKETPESGILSLSESDMFASTFWISNPNNYFLGNVAAGSEDTGIWYEMLEIVRGPSVRLDPNYETNPASHIFGYFKENVVHSNTGEGFKLYPNGYFPDERAVFQNTRAYKNKGDGVLLHNSKNLGVDGGIYSDNRMQIEVDKQSDDVTVTNAYVVGFSNLYQFEAEAAGLKSHCPAHRPISGVQLHSFLRFRDSKGYHLENITFANFNDAAKCIGSTAIEMDRQLRDGHFDAYATFKNLTFEEGSTMAEKFNMCVLSRQPMFMHDLAINDLSGDLNPDGTNVPGFIISNSTIMQQFVPTPCKDMEGSCSLYCEGVCYQTVNFAVPNAFAFDDMILEVTNTDTGGVAEFPGYFESKTTIKNNDIVEDKYENFVYARRRFYSPILPVGNYEMVFKMNGSPHWPQMVEQIWEDPPECSPHIDETTTTFITPSPTEEECAQLIRNGGGEDGTHNYWMHSGGGIQVVEGGYAGSYAISSVSRVGAWQGPGQFLDTRCLTEGAQYEIMMKFKLVDLGGNELNCDINQKNIGAFDVCPRVSMRMRKLLGNKIGDGTEVNYAYPVAETVGPFKPGEWNNIYGVFSVTETMAKSEGVFMFVERARTGANIVIDEVTVQATQIGCNNIIKNGNFEKGDTRFWTHMGTSKIDIAEDGYEGLYSLQTTKRGEFWSGMVQYVNLDCLVEGQTYSVNGMIKLLTEAGGIETCDSNKQWGPDGNSGICPTMAMRIKTGNLTTDEYMGSVVGTWVNGEWNQISGSFVATPNIINADDVCLYFTRYHPSVMMRLDALTMTPIEGRDPNQLINNGDVGIGDVRFFKISGCGTVTTVEGFDVATKSDDLAFKVSGRTHDNCGIKQDIDNNYLEANTLYKIAAKVKLYGPDGVAPFECDPNVITGDKMCPVVTLTAQNHGIKGAYMRRTVASIQGEFTLGAWNTIEGYITFMANEMRAGSLNYVIHGAPANVVMVLDNIVLSKGDEIVAVAR